MCHHCKSKRSGFNCLEHHAEYEPKVLAINMLAAIEEINAALQKLRGTITVL